MPRFRIYLSPSHGRLKRLVDALCSYGLPESARTIYRGRNIVAEACGVNIKEYSTPGLIKGLIYGNLRRSKARRAYTNAERLRALGFDTPEPMAWIEERCGALLGRTYFISTQLEGYNDVRYLQRRPERDEVIASMAALLARLHNAGVFMKDFSPGNVLYRRMPDGSLEWMLIDINRMEFGHIPDITLMRNLAQILDLDEDVEKLARAYAAERGLDIEQTVRIALRLRRRNVRRMSRNRKIKKFLRP